MSNFSHIAIYPDQLKKTKAKVGKVSRELYIVESIKADYRSRYMDGELGDIHELDDFDYCEILGLWYEKFSLWRDLSEHYHSVKFAMERIQKKEEKRYLRLEAKMLRDSKQII